MTCKKNVIILIILIFSGLAYGADDITPKNKDSGLVKPIESPVVNYPAHEVPNESIINEDYSALLRCPDKPTNCPTINEPKNDRTNVTCPSQCRVDRKTDPDYGNTIPRNSHINWVVNAVCPPDYAQVAVFNMGPQINHMNKTPVTPVKYADLQDYKDQNYTCTPQGTSQTAIACLVRRPTEPVDPFLPWNKEKEYNGFAVSYASSAEGNCYAPEEHDCTQGPGLDCKMNPGAFMKKFTGQFQYYRCDPPQRSLYYDPSIKVPTSIVCAHVRPVWKSIPAAPTKP